jgi:hypothetical protein
VTYQTDRIRTFAALARRLEAVKEPVLLVEGIRALPETDRAAVVAMGRMLAGRLPRVIFRSGNAEGTDTGFAAGVCAVDPARMEYVLTHEGMGRKRRHPVARGVGLDQLPHAAEGPVGDYTVKASPDLAGLVEAYRTREGAGPLGRKAVYLLRDTLKVIGAPELGLAPAVAGVFYVNEAAPLSGGTGHTIRVCLQREVPVVFQAVWRNWLE